mmetsp:Transcript_73477/g.226886  ORF Transcript_73477/g.226886 Transcript_73477/m.226886 type:complete len:128 (-) Transcript_73477:154-537(-)
MPEVGMSSCSQDSIVTVMVCCLPLDLTAVGMADYLRQSGFDLKFNYVSIVLRRQPKSTEDIVGGRPLSMGYGFVNFWSPVDAARFITCFSRSALGRAKPAVLQGLSSCLERSTNARARTHCDVLLSF